MDPDTSDEAIACAARDDPSAFVPLYERYVVRIYRYCRLRLSDPTRAEDATSEVFLRAMERIAG
ncbi:MAG: sigma factor, partial [Nitriliruptoraceae bacterium]